jgi:hypothetical protein
MNDNNEATDIVPQMHQLSHTERGKRISEYMEFVKELTMYQIV